MADDLRRRAEAWLAADPDPGTRAELRAALDADDRAALAEAFDPPLAFGTAGIRGPIGPGPARMNRLVVRRVTAALAERLGAEGSVVGRAVVLGRDARHGSAAFAEEAAATLADAGLEVLAFPEPVPTPLVAFAVRHCRAAAGVQITASHNPAGDNGYKVYWSDGAQIGPEVADDIAARASAGAAPASRHGRVRAAPDVAGAHRRACLALTNPEAPRRLRVVVTALHGVAGDALVDLLAAAGFDDVHPVAEQHAPDPDFPTAPRPNPEEPGALDLALERGAEVDADLVLATDPDGDRLAVAVPAPGGWRPLRGDETGCALAEHLLARGRGSDRLVATTVVSSRLLSRIAAAHGVRYAETLTGFKWLARATIAAEAEGVRPVLAYEQALGIMAGSAVRDKDGLSAALVAADCAAGLAAQGRGLPDLLEDLARRHGVHRTAERSVALEPGQDPGGALDTVLAAAPARLGGADVVETVDHRGGHGDLSPADLVTLRLGDGGKAQVRPSGTEPRLKLYLEAVEPVVGDAVAAATGRADARLAAAEQALVGLVGA